MSTRCNIHFTENGSIVANIYRHSDGYPDSESGVLADLDKFFADVEAQTGSDCRFNDAEYLAARFVVWQAAQNSRNEQPLNFLGLGVCSRDHGDIEYVYEVKCDTYSRPVIVHRPTRAR